MLACAVDAAESTEAFGPVYKGGHMRSLELRVPRVLLVGEQPSTPGVITSCLGSPVMEHGMVALDLIPFYEVCSLGYIVRMVPALILGLHHSV